MPLPIGSLGVLILAAASVGPAPVSAADMAPAVSIRLGQLRVQLEDTLYGKETLIAAQTYPISGLNFPSAPPSQHGDALVDFAISSAVRRLVDDRNTLRNIAKKLREIADHGFASIKQDLTLRKDDEIMVKFYVDAFKNKAKELEAWTERPMKDMVKNDFYESLFRWYDAIEDKSAKDMCIQLVEMVKNLLEHHESHEPDPIKMHYLQDSLFNVLHEIKYCEKFKKDN